MPAYKALMYGVTVLLLGVGAYYMYTPGNSDMLAQGMTQGDAGSYGVSAMQVFSGKYECQSNAGCETRTMLKMYDDGTFEFVEFLENGDTPVLGHGNWGVGKNGALVFLVVASENPDAPSSKFSLIAKKVSSYSISGFSKKDFFSGISNAIFTRVSD